MANITTNTGYVNSNRNVTKAITYDTLKKKQNNSFV